MSSTASPRPIIVTGAAGFAGRHLLERLGSSTPLIGWHRPGGSPPLPIPHVTWVAVDLSNRADVESAVADARPSAIYHLAGAPQVDTSWHSAVPHLKANVLGTTHVLDAMRAAAQDARLLVTSSAQVYQMGDTPIDETAPLIPSNPYGLSKLAQEQLALHAAVEDDLHVVVARPFNHAGPGQKPAFVISSFARQIAEIDAGLAAPVMRVGNLDATRDITDVRDVVDAYVKMIDAPSGSVFNVCSGRAWRVRALLDMLASMSGRSVTIEIDPARLRPSDLPILVGDASRLRGMTGWQPTRSIEQTLRDTLDYWRAQINLRT